MASSPPAMASSPPAFDRAVSLENRCGESKSPYVRSHIDNPTAWQLWTPETLELARRTNRLLFVSIGYSACHWCHVMAHESFDHPRIAQLLNEHFIPIKIDREERPDIDRQYMDFLQATSGGGGWPLNVFVTPDLEPIFGGTYWPGPTSERAQTSSGGGGGGVTFEQVLVKLAAAWKEQEARCRESAKQITQQLREFAQEGTLQDANDDGDGLDDGLELDILDDAFQHYKSRYDAKSGGFGSAPKFPTPVHIRPLLRVACYPRDVREIIGEAECAQARAMAVNMLEHMAKGGIKDQIGHGFARYSVTRDWSLPHFEKMLYDNSQLLPVYLDAYLLTGSPLFLETLHDIAQYLTTPPIASPLGAFHASEDADSLPHAQSQQKREGAFYVWRMDEFDQALSPEESRVCAKYWGVKAEGNIDPWFDAQGELAGLNTLCVQCDPADLAADVALPEADVRRILHDARLKLRAYREKHRPRPALDDKIVTAWNGLAIGGLARAGAALQCDAYLAAAARAADCIRAHLYDAATHTLRRVYRDGPGATPGFADDYAFFIAGLLDLYEATFASGWLRWADALQATQLAAFWDPARHAFFSTPARQPDILVRSKDALDHAEPSVNGVAAANLFRLASLLHDARYDRLARQTVACFEVEIGQHPGLFSGLLSSVVASRMGMRGLMIVGPAGDDGQGHAVVDAALRVARENVRPNCTVLRIGGGGGGGGDSSAEDDAWLRERNSLLRDLDPAKPMVQLCEAGACRLLDLSAVETLFRS